MEKYIPYMLAVAFVASFYGLCMSLSLLVRPFRGNRGHKNTSTPEPRIQTKICLTVRYRTLMIMMGIFFAATVLLYPVVAAIGDQQLRQFNASGESEALWDLLKLVVFLLLFAISVGYAWIRGDLSWLKLKDKE